MLKIKLPLVSLESLVFLLASGISVALIYNQVPKSTLFVILSILLAGLLVFYSKYPLSYLQLKEHRLHLLATLFSGGLFIQLLLVATGGFFSAFVIILHLFTLGMSFVFNVSSAITYLVLSVGVLIATILFDPQMNQLFQNDPWSFMLHGISFLVVIPLAHIVVSSYHLKDTVSKMLTEHLATKELQDESIFRGIGEFVIITDQNANILFANEAIKKALSLESKELIGESLIKVLPLKSESGIPIDTKTLSIDQAVADRSVHKVNGFSLNPKQGGRSLPVLIQVRPIFETTGILKQIVFVITPDVGATSTDAVDRSLLKSRRQTLMEELETQFQNAADPLAHQHFLFLMAQIEDVMLYQEIETHGIVEQKSLFDGLEFLKSNLNGHKNLLNASKLEIDFLDTQEELVRLATITGAQGFSLYSHLKNNFLVSVDQNYLQLILDRIIRLLIILNTTAQEKKLVVRVGHNDSDLYTIVIAVHIDPQLGISSDQLMLQNYGALSHENALAIGSGLEGLLIKKIAELTGTQFSLTFSQKSSYLLAILALPKNQ